VTLRRVLGAGVGLAAIAGAVIVICPRRIGDDLAELSPEVIGLCVVLIAIDTSMTMLRWMYLVRHDVPLSPAHHARIYLYSNFLNAFGMGSVTGDGYRIIRLRRSAGSASRVVALLVRERSFGLTGYALGYLLSAGALIAAGTGSSGGLFRWLAIGIAGAVIASPAIIFTVRRLSSRYHRKDNRLGRIAMVVRLGLELGSARDITICLMLSLLAWVAWVAAVVSLAGPMRTGLSWPALACIATLTEFIRFVPITFQGLGVREASFAVLVRVAGGTDAHGFALGAVAYLLLTASFLASAPIAWGLGVLADHQPSQESPPAPDAEDYLGDSDGARGSR